MDRLEAIIRTHFFHPALFALKFALVPIQQVPSLLAQLQFYPGVKSHWFYWSLEHWNQQIENAFWRTHMHIDPVTNLIKIIQLQVPKPADNACSLFKNHWLSPYCPCPTKVNHGHSSEFKGHDFQFSLDYGLFRSQAGQNWHNFTFARKINSSLNTVYCAGPTIGCLSLSWGVLLVRNPTFQIPFLIFF